MFELPEFVTLAGQMNDTLKGKTIQTGQLEMKAKRPPFSALETIELSKYVIERRGWKKALHDYLIEKGHILALSSIKTRRRR